MIISSISEFGTTWIPTCRIKLDPYLKLYTKKSTKVVVKDLNLSWQTMILVEENPIVFINAWGHWNGQGFFGQDPQNTENKSNIDNRVKRQPTWMGEYIYKLWI
jgi:hypothetical protein